jgi:hypothetical protein
MGEEPNGGDAIGGRKTLQSVRGLAGDLRSENHDLSVDRFQEVTLALSQNEEGALRFAGWPASLPPWDT